MKNKEARKMGMTCACGKCDLALFEMYEIEVIINMKDLDEQNDRT